VEVGRDLRAGRHRFDHSPTHVRGMWRGKADTLDAVNLGGSPQQIGKIAGPLAISINSLAEGDDFFLTPGRPLSDPRQQCGQRHATLATADVGHNTKSAEFVTAAHHRDPGTYPLPARRSDVRVSFVTVQAD